MLTLTAPHPDNQGRYAERRSIAVANVNWFRKLAWRALRDGSPRGAMRAAAARAAARIVIRQAKRDALISRMAHEALESL
ncbi:MULTISPECIES: hypothetical protein [Methylobacterium]|uniref:Uncharacterized protein n=1 Tax=Methylobacterium longum TaxID=767694 RepID=A0ABT8APJ7_9HYPH|nr:MULTISPECIES: hypothetical protein [Methylobacterium]MCJ2101046.1 hypothetical protein [Methylobacterium sp. E-046]MDN3571632.1 hypothetical protein [Methylobacterium longum]GJE11705.1 hypothetical protein FOHLNKBM_2749 [Methylobacterium longum]